MSVNRHLCRCGHNVTPLAQQLWISDDVLNAAIKRFGQFALSKRDIGFAPGPLEARKRGNKRRLAHVSQGNGSLPDHIDPSLLSGVNERARLGNWNWKGPDTSHLPPPPPLPSWSADLLHWPETPFMPAHRQPENAFDLHNQQLLVKGEAQQRKYTSILRELGDCQSLEELQNAASMHAIDVRQHSREVFRQLYKNTDSLEIYLGFLSNDRFDDPDAGNLHFLTDRLFQCLTGLQDADLLQFEQQIQDTMIPWIKIQLSLGMRGLPDVEALIQFIHRLSRNEMHVVLTRDLAIAVLEGLRSSTVQNFKDLTPDMRRSLLGAIVDGNLTLELQELGLSLAKTTESIAVISQFLANCIRSEPALQGLIGTDEWCHKIIPQITQLLEARPRAAARAIATITSKTLVEWQAGFLHDSAEGKKCTRLVSLWWHLVSRFMGPREPQYWHEILKVKRSNPVGRLVVLTTYASHLHECNQAELIFSSWYFRRLPTNRFQNIYSDLKQSLLAETSDSRFFCMLRTVQDKLGLEDAFVHHVFRVLARLHKTRIVNELIQKSKDINMHIPPDAVTDVIRFFLSFSFRTAYDVFRYDPRISLERLPDLAHRLIKNPKVHPDAVWHYQAKRPWHPTRDAFPATEYYLKARERLLDSMALAFSEAPNLTLRMKQKHLGKGLRCVRREERLPSERMMLALLRTTILLPLQEKGYVSTDAITRFLTMFREAEGDKASDHIDWILHEWRTELKKQQEMRRERDPDCPRQQGPLDFIFHRKWSESQLGYDLVMIPDRKRRESQHGEGALLSNPPPILSMRSRKDDKPPGFIKERVVAFKAERQDESQPGVEMIAEPKNIKWKDSQPDIVETAEPKDIGSKPDLQHNIAESEVETKARERNHDSPPADLSTKAAEDKSEAATKPLPQRFIFTRQWSPTHRAYDLVMSPDRGSRPQLSEEET